MTLYRRETRCALHPVNLHPVFLTELQRIPLEVVARVKGVKWEDCLRLGRNKSIGISYLNKVDRPITIELSLTNTS